MKYSALFFVVFLIFLFFSTRSFADFILSPIAVSKPTITFGHLLDGSYKTQKTKIGMDDPKLQKLLTLLEKSSEESYALAKPYIPTPTQVGYPTPYIAIPSLIAGVYETSGQSSTNETQSFNMAYSSGTSTNSNYGNMNINPIQSTLTIALLGDSMIDTMGKDLPQLQSLLKNAYPDKTFILLNYGQGATDMEKGLNRLNEPSTYRGAYFPSLLSFKPDILVLESFAYNHWSASLDDLNRQWITIAHIIDTVGEQSPDTKIILAATIAPDGYTYGDGTVNWTAQTKWDFVQTTKAYLQNMINFATSQQYPLADAFHESLDTSGNGMKHFINQNDHIHPSDAGAQLFSQKIVEAIQKNNLIL